MTVYCLIYDPVTGEITGRISASDPAQLENYPSRIEVDVEKYSARPEIFTKVRLDTKELEPLELAQIAAKLRSDEVQAAKDLGEAKVILDLKTEEKG